METQPQQQADNGPATWAENPAAFAEFWEVAAAAFQQAGPGRREVCNNAIGPPAELAAFRAELAAAAGPLGELTAAERAELAAARGYPAAIVAAVERRAAALRAERWAALLNAWGELTAAERAERQRAAAAEYRPERQPLETLPYHPARNGC